MISPDRAPSSSTEPHPRFKRTLVWFRRDLRSVDHAALHQALSQSEQVFCVFVFDTDILDPLLALGLQTDRRVAFIHASVVALRAELQVLGGDLIVRHASAVSALPQLAQALQVDAVFANLDYEPTAIERDRQVMRALKTNQRQLLCFKDQVVFHQNEVLTQAGRPFSVFTPYKNAWLKRLRRDGDWASALFDPESAITSYPVVPLCQALAAPLPDALAASIPSLKDMGFTSVDLASCGLEPGMDGGEGQLDAFTPHMAEYAFARDFPALEGTSGLSVHLRFGTVSIRSLVRRALEVELSGEAAPASERQPAATTSSVSAPGRSGALTWLSELIWRDFYFMILDHFPQVATDAFKPEYDNIEWESGAEADALFVAWCQGSTGYPLIDAAMRHFAASGQMHNRLRMVTASFLIKDLGLDWRRGEAYFARTLNDYDQAANNGGWQWAASSGCDAQPFFRIFNPVTQSRKFDADGVFIRRHLPELAALDARALHEPWLAPAAVLQRSGIVLGQTYPRPVVEHDVARLRTLERYAVVKK